MIARDLDEFHIVARGPRRRGEPVEVAAYFVVSESLTNVGKHAHATVATSTSSTVLTSSVPTNGRTSRRSACEKPTASAC